MKKRCGRARSLSFSGGAAIPPRMPSSSRVARAVAAALLVSIGAPRLSRLGFPVENALAGPETRLYELLERADPDSAHSRYNALIRRLASFEQAAECVSR